MNSKSHAAALRTGSDAAAITPSDTATFDLCRALWIGGSGTIKIRTARGSDVSFVVLAGGELPMQATMVWSTGTTATNIVAIY